MNNGLGPSTQVKTGGSQSPTMPDLWESVSILISRPVKTGKGMDKPAILTVSSWFSKLILVSVFFVILKQRKELEILSEETKKTLEPMSNDELDNVAGGTLEQTIPWTKYRWITIKFWVSSNLRSIKTTFKNFRKRSILATSVLRGMRSHHLTLKLQ